jgi:hypothetical protein
MALKGESHITLPGWIGAVKSDHIKLSAIASAAVSASNPQPVEYPPVQCDHFPSANTTDRYKKQYPSNLDYRSLLTSDLCPPTRPVKEKLNEL